MREFFVSLWRPRTLVLVVILAVAISRVDGRAVQVDPQLHSAVAEQPSSHSEAAAEPQAGGATSGIEDLDKVHEHSRKSIDGAVNPELISNDVAYSLFFQMLRRISDGTADREQQQAYVRHVLTLSGGGQAPSASDVSTIIAFADSYEGRMRGLDSDRAAANSVGNEAWAQTLAERKRELVRDLVAEASLRLNGRLASLLHQYVTVEVKRKTKIVL